MLGVTHAQISSRLLAGWGLPEMVYEAVATHHSDGPAVAVDRSQSFAAILWSAAALADLLCGDVDSLRLDEVRNECIRRSGISQEDLEEALQALDAQVTETADLMALKIGETTSYDALRGQAVTQLTAITMDAELGRVQAARQVESTRQELERVSVQASTDTLTKIANRLTFESHLDAAIARAQESQGNLGLIMVDLDHFKRLNDTHGHQAGDQALRLIGQCLGKISRGPVLCARYGGEEFAIVVSDVTAPKLENLADKIRTVIERLSFKYGDAQVSFTASMGVAHVSFARDRVDAAELISRADEALYQAKRNGRNRVEVSS
jgi:diguanylate cyclase